MVRLIDHVLSSKGFQVLKAGNGQEALRLFFVNRPDLVILDVVMPRMDGWQTCSRIREISDVPIIILTGREMTEESIVRGLDYGADEYLIKPVGNRELVARVRAILRRAELTSARDLREGPVYSDARLTIDITDRRVLVDGERVEADPAGVPPACPSGGKCWQGAHPQTVAGGGVGVGVCRRFGLRENLHIASAAEAGAGTGPAKIYTDRAGGWILL